MADDHDDDLLKALGRIAADDAQRSAKHERVATRTASEDDLAELARLEESGTAEEKALAAAARPLDHAARDRIAGALAAKMAPRQRAERRWGRFGVIAGGLALAASIAFLVLRRDPYGLPTYTIDPTSAASMRSPSATDSTNGCALRASDAGEFEIILRPSNATRGAVTAQMLVRKGNETRSLAGEVEVAPSGSIRIHGQRSGLVGASSLLVVVGLPSAFANNALYKAQTTEQGEGWQSIGCAIVAPH